MTAADRICDLDRAEVPYAEGLYVPTLKLFLHARGRCHDALKVAERDYSHSKRGRWRTPKDVRRLLALEFQS